MSGAALYLIAVNVFAFVLFGVDKWKAAHGKWRIREAALFGISIAGGAPGGLLAMHVFRHKTKKKRFALGLPGIILLQFLAFLAIKSSGVL